MAGPTLAWAFQASLHYLVLPGLQGLPPRHLTAAHRLSAKISVSQPETNRFGFPKPSAHTGVGG
jgi:hypothetical protein